MQTQDFNLSKAAYSVNELLSILPFGRTSLYLAVKDGKLKATKFGKKTLFLAGDVAAFLSKLSLARENSAVVGSEKA